MATVVLNIAIQSQKQPSQAQTLVFVQDLISLDKTAFIESKALILVELMRQGPVISACNFRANTVQATEKSVSCRHEQCANPLATSTFTDDQRCDASDSSGLMKQLKNVEANYTDYGVGVRHDQDGIHRVSAQQTQLFAYQFL